MGMSGSAAVVAAERLRKANERVEFLEHRVGELERVLAAPRHRWVDRIRDRVRALPVLDRIARSLGTRLGRN